MLYLNSDRLQEISQHAEQTYPQECCGLLIGKLDGHQKIITRIKPTVNVWQDQRTEYWPAETIYTTDKRYAIAPHVMLETMKEVRDQDLSIIGIYHSHPDYPPYPSEFDRVYAWPEYSYVIVAVEQGKVKEILSWCLDEQQQFRAENIVLNN